MKKKVLFMLINMNIGGTEKAFLNMISELSPENYEVTLLLLERNGGFLESVPRHVKIIVFEEYREVKNYIINPLHKVAFNKIKQGCLNKALIFLSLYIISKIQKEYSILYKCLLRHIKLTTETFDIAIAFAGPMDFISYFIIKKIKARRKYQWIHFDITKIGFNKNFASKYYTMFDRVFVVSNEGRDKVIKMLPELSKRTRVFRNKVSNGLVKQMAEHGAGFKDDFKGKRILTVGRLNWEKGQDLAIKVMAKLKQEGINARWYCVGEGNARAEYEELIKKYEIQQEFFLLGSSTNPYKLMEQCDIYIQPSRHEGFCITLAEAKCFQNPIISTNFTGAIEQLENVDNAEVVEFNVDQIVRAIKKICL